MRNKRTTAIATKLRSGKRVRKFWIPMLIPTTLHRREHPNSDAERLMLSHGYGRRDSCASRRRDGRSRWLQRLVRQKKTMPTQLVTEPGLEARPLSVCECGGTITLFYLPNRYGRTASHPTSPTLRTYAVHQPQEYRSPALPYR
jgi:hypothetical protein